MDATPGPVTDKPNTVAEPFVWLHLSPERGLVVESNIDDPKAQNALLDAAKVLLVNRIIQSVSPRQQAVLKPNWMARRLFGR